MDLKEILCLTLKISLEKLYSVIVDAFASKLSDYKKRDFLMRKQFIRITSNHNS